MEVLLFQGTTSISPRGVSLRTPLPACVKILKKIPKTPDSDYSHPQAFIHVTVFLRIRVTGGLKPLLSLTALERSPASRPPEDREMDGTLGLRKSLWGGGPSRPGICGSVGIHALSCLSSSLFRLALPWSVDVSVFCKRAARFLDVFWRNAPPGWGRRYVHVQVLLAGARVSAVLPDVQLVPALRVGILPPRPGHLLQVGPRGAALVKALRQTSHL